MPDLDRKRSRRGWTSTLFPALLGLTLVATGCVAVEDAAPDDREAVSSCGGKCDGTDIRLLSTLTRLDYEAGQQSFRLVAQLREAYADEVTEGHHLRVELFSGDTVTGDNGGSIDAGSSGAGSSDAGSTVDAGGPDDTGSSVDAGSPDDTGSSVDAGAAVQLVEADLFYSTEDGAFVSDTLDTSALLPYETLNVRISGSLGDASIDQTFVFALGSDEGAEALPDPFEAAYDVEAAVIYLDEAFPAPSYDSPRSFSPFGLGGTEFWQKWEGGLNPTYSYGAGTEAGRRCMYASARRFEAIMVDPPQALIALEADTNWSGRFFNWNDDFSHEESQGTPRGAFLWAWRTSLIKWASQTGKDGACHLPTFDLVERAATSCLSRGEHGEGEIEGCQASN